MIRSKKSLLAAACAVALSTSLFGNVAQAQERKLRLQMASSYGSTLPILGESALAFTKRVATASNGAIDIKFNEPNALVPVLQSFDAVSQGSVDVAWTASSFWSGKDTAFNFFSSVPFGPGVGEYMAWLQRGEGKALKAELYGKYGIHAITCGMLPPEGAGWFRQEVKSVDDLKGMKMRFLGMGAKVMEKLGVATQLIAPGEIYQALQLGTIDATEFSTPAMDVKLGFYQVAKYYYFPGWHQQATALDVLFNKKKWDAMSDSQKALIEQACGDTLQDSIAIGEATQFAALEEMKAKGVELKKWGPEFMAAYRKAWDEVVVEESAKNPNFKRINDSFTAFRKQYKAWGDYGFVRD
jgi:TRAP-type mannitol/chloroaromatic compound transport system substrate-binding protein